MTNKAFNINIQELQVPNRLWHRITDTIQENQKKQAIKPWALAGNLRVQMGISLCLLLMVVSGYGYKVHEQNAKTQQVNEYLYEVITDSLSVESSGEFNSELLI